MNIYKLEIECYNDDKICDFYISTQSTHWKNIQKTEISKEYLNSWQIPDITIYQEDINKIINPNDFSILWGVSKAPIVTKKVKDIFEKMYGIQFLPVRVISKHINIEKEYFLMNIFNYIDCLDLEKSKIIRL